MQKLTIRTKRGTFSKVFATHKEASEYFRTYSLTHRVLGYSITSTQ